MRGGWNTKLHMVAASGRDGVTLALSAGNCGDAPEGRALLRQLGPAGRPVYLLMDRAYEGGETRALAIQSEHFYKLDIIFLAFVYFALIADALM